MKPHLRVLEDSFTIHRFAANTEIPKQVFEGQFYSISKSEEELSIVCTSSVRLNAEKSEGGWSCIQVLGPLDFSLTGILADISAVLAKAKISIFAVSTFDTDYILLKSEELEIARKFLQQVGYPFS
jgi:hypothetical protein